MMGAAFIDDGRRADYGPAFFLGDGLGDFETMRALSRRYFSPLDDDTAGSDDI